MPSRTDLITLRDQLIESRASGVREWQDQNGERVAYRSDSEIKAAIEGIERQIQNFDRRPASTIVFRTSKGF